MIHLEKKITVTLKFNGTGSVGSIGVFEHLYI